MGKRRPSGDGMVRQREDGRWEGRIVAGHKKNGEPIFRYVFANTQKELMLKLHQRIEEYRGVDLQEDSKLSLSEWLDRWLEKYMVNTVRESTLRGYRQYIRDYIKPCLGEKQVCKITTQDVQKMYQKLRQGGRIHEHPKYGHQLSDASIRKIHGVLHQAMNAAVREQLAVRNPTTGIVLPPNKTTPKRILNKAQVERFMEEIKKDEHWHDFFYTEITTGLRRGEICGLMWSDFDAKKGVLKIRRSVSTVPGGGVSIGETKTGQGRRDIVLPPSTAELLRTRKENSFTQWIFPHLLKPEQPMYPDCARNRLKVLLNSAGLPDIRFHDLRHTFATHALTSGVDAKTLSGILGHTKASFTLDTYTHVTGDMHQRASEIVGGFMKDLIVRS